ncbi:D-alanyl-D-alanine carboxypeptidase family protein [Anaerocolumna sp.]|uniref:D-alanyl-D-alanine carboxypeptidase family protein n=1 Tax=Anaerocolumna sp. TaxID=2041569 RepID=UPI0028A8D216|nr:D-alanyl-D-alanine carboxypeptidase family protein [Anaerocolumna sp.]
MKKCLILMSLICLTFSNVITAKAEVDPTAINYSNSIDKKAIVTAEQPEVNASAAIVMEASTGAILYSKNVQEAYYPASITKILTTLLALENSSLRETVTFSKESVFDVDLDSSRIGIDVGEKLTMEESLYGIMLESANEVSYAVAEHISGDVDSFADLMNKKAKELGATNSHFINPHGLPDPEHYTCAYDMALIARAAINNPTFRKITSTRTFTIPPTNIQEKARPLANHHKFINGAIPFEGAIGGKTGYTSKAKYTLVTFAERNGMTLISVIMSCDSIKDEYSDTSNILNYGFNNFSVYNIAEMENPVDTESISLFNNNSPVFSTTKTALKISPESNIILPNDASLKDVKKEIEFKPITKLVEGQHIIGTVSYTYNGMFAGTSNIIFNNVATDTLLKSSILPLQTVEPNTGENGKHIIGKSNISMKSVVIGVFVGMVVLGAGLYIIFVEIPYRKRRQAYHQKRNRRKHSSDTSYIDF